MSAPLTERELAILELESRGLRAGGTKDELVRSELGIAPARYYQLLGRLLDSPAALAHDPQLVRRLQRARDGRRDRAASQERALRARLTGTRG